MLRSPTFLVGTEKQQGILEEFQKRDEHISTDYVRKNVPLCFSAEAYQKTHPAKQRLGFKDADATLTSPMLLGVCDGVSQLEEFGMDPSELPIELLTVCEELGINQLMPDAGYTKPSDSYRGPISLLAEAYEATESLGSTTVLLAALDNMTRIHGKLHPMVAVLSIGDCELLMLRRMNGAQSELEAVFHTEMQRIDGHVQTPLQLARVDERIDADFDEEVAYEVIRKGSAVHCVSAYEGDILVLGSDGVFDNLFLDEIIDACNEALPPLQQGEPFAMRPPSILRELSKKLVLDAHKKSGTDGKQKVMDSPIGKGGKVDDTSVVVAEVVEWTQAHRDAWREMQRHQKYRKMFGCFGGGKGGSCASCPGMGGDEIHHDAFDDHEEDYSENHVTSRGVKVNVPVANVPTPGQEHYAEEYEEEYEEEEEERRCVIS